MDLGDLEYQGTLTAMPCAQPDVPVLPDGIPETGDRDWRLVDALRRHDATAAERLVAAFGDRAYRLAIGITGNRQDAEDAVQDALWNVVRKIDTFRGRSSFRSWIYRITANAAYQKRRSGAHRHNGITLVDVAPRFDEDGRHADPMTDWSTKLADPAIQREMRDALASALDELPPRYRAAIVLRDVEGLSTAEVADALGIMVGTAKTRAHRARLLLRKRLSAFMASASASAERNGAGNEVRNATADIRVRKGGDLDLLTSEEEAWLHPNGSKS
jgi:RNA polymerase sigma-70 factor, ECF subfamily